MTTKNILILAGLGVAAVGIYTMMKPPAGIPWGAQQIPPGGQYNGYYNQSGVPAWVTTTGAILGIINGVVTSLGQVPWGSFGGGSSLPSSNPDSGQGQWVDEGDGLVWHPYK